MFNALEGIVSSIDMELTIDYKVINERVEAAQKSSACGRSSFKKACDAFANRLSISNSNHKLDPIRQPLFIQNSTQVKISSVYTYLWPELRAGFSHYFRYLYRILKVIDESGLNDADKIKFSRIVRSQLSDYELLIIFYNCQSEYGKNLIPYVLKYRLLDNLLKDLCINDDHFALVQILNGNPK